MAEKTPQPPKHLKPESKAFWLRIVQDFDLEPAHLHLLRQACEAMDAAEQHRQIVANDGPTVRDRFEQVREHPSAKAQRDYMHQYRQAVKFIGLLDEEPDADAPGRRPAVVAQPRSAKR
ncbi:P27 family phage terminase small subunit [Phycisphaerales bacterium AB-hyl4]|uniref:P27 family phage terminase small subunit n=1 Tax=Natronomicrosphaera hydrolytica TaxID=3242702 RepID=A0ABV4U0I8_9BACT